MRRLNAVPVGDDQEPADLAYARRMEPWASDVMCLGHVTDAGEPVLMLFADTRPDVEKAMAGAGLLTERGRLTRADWSEAQSMFRAAAEGAPPGGFHVECVIFPDGATGGLRMHVSLASTWGVALAQQVAERFRGLVVIEYTADAANNQRGVDPPPR